MLDKNLIKSDGAIEKLKNVAEDWIDSSKRSILVMIFFVYVLTLWIAGSENLNKENFSGFTIILFMFAMIYVYKDKIFKTHKWIYYIIQGIVVFDFALLIHNGYETIYISLLSVLIFESLIDFEQKGYVLLVAFLYYGMFSGLIIYIDGLEELKFFLPLLGFVTFAVWTFNSMYLKQVHLRVKSQKMSRELETANIRIEKMTLERERERVARDLHDTLSQGLSALVLQMETMSVYLENGNTKKLNMILAKSTDHARRTLSESRQVLLDLRENSHDIQDVRMALNIEIERFREQFSGMLNVDMKTPILLDVDYVVQLHFICRELLTNILRHACAKKVNILLYCSDGKALLRVTDDGVGFDPKMGMTKANHFGLQGMEERVKTIKGEMNIFSRKKKGTTVDISFDIQ